MSENLKRSGSPVVEDGPEVEDEDDEEEEDGMIFTQVPEAKVQTVRKRSSSGGKVVSQDGQMAVGKADGHVGKKRSRSRRKRRKKCHEPGET